MITILEATWITAIWSAKAASLKALHLGLKVDTRSVSCVIEPLSKPPENWTRFCIDSVLPETPQLAGWWRVHAGYVLTLVVKSYSQTFNVG